MRTDGGTSKRKLRKLRVDKVDLVPGGANRGAVVTLAKAEHPVHKEDDSMPDNDTPTLADELAALSDDEQQAVSQYVADLIAELESGKAEVDELKSRLDAVEAAAGGSDDDSESESDDELELVKSLDPEVQALVRKMQTQTAEAIEKADRIEKAERERVFKARAAALASITGGEGEGVERLGSVLEQAERLMDADSYSELERTLVAADEQIEKGKLFASVGSDDAPGGEFVSTVKSRADALVADGADPIEALRQARREQGNDAARDHFDDISRGQR